MTGNQIFHNFISTFGGRRHRFYERCLHISNICRLLRDAEPTFANGQHNAQAPLYIKHQREGSQERFDNAIDRTPIKTPDIIKSVENKFRQIDNAGVLKNLREIVGSPEKTAMLQSLLSNYTTSTTQQVDLLQYLTVGMPIWNGGGQCNAILITTRTQLGINEYSTAPMLVEPENVIDFAGGKNELTYCIIRKFKNVQDTKGDWIELPTMQLYLPYYAIEGELVKELPVDIQYMNYDKMSDYSGIYDTYMPTKLAGSGNDVITVTNNNVLYVAINKDKQIYCKLTFYNHGCPVTPAIQVGYIEDNFTLVIDESNNRYEKSNLFVPYWWQGLGRLITNLVDVKSLQATIDNFAYPIVYIYEVPCGTCASKFGSNKDCAECGGTGRHLPKTANEYIGVKMPKAEDMSDRLPLQEMVYQVPVDLENAQKLSEWIKTNVDDFYKYIFGVNIFETMSGGMTATEIRTRKESENQAIWTLAKRITFIYKRSAVYIAFINSLISNANDIVVDFEFPTYLVPMSLETLAEDIIRARKAEFPNFILSTMMRHVVDTLYADDTVKRRFSALLSEVDVYYPMTYQNRIMMNGLVPNYIYYYAINVEAILRELFMKDNTIIMMPASQVYDLIITICKERSETVMNEAVNPNFE